MEGKKGSKNDAFLEPDPDVVDDPFFPDPIMELNPDQATPLNSLHPKSKSSSSSLKTIYRHIAGPVILINAVQPCYSTAHMNVNKDPVDMLISNIVNGHGKPRKKVSTTSVQIPVTSFTTRTRKYVPLLSTTNVSPLSASHPILPPNMLLPET